MLVNCPNCRTLLQLPPGAGSIRCVICHVTFVVYSRALPPQPSSSTHAPPLLRTFNHEPPGPPPNPHGRKKAVIIGISYKFSRHELKGCIDSAKCMRYLLVNKFSFPESSIIMLTEEEDPHGPKFPYKENIRMAMYWLVQGCQPGDSLFFYYAGHGSQQRNYNGDEADGYDETICPFDFTTEGIIVDDEINAALVRPLPLGVKLHALIDACHSGTVLDLPFLCRMNSRGQYVWEDHRPKSGVWKGSNGGEVICFSACDDHQTSADTSTLSKWTRVMTFCFIQAIEKHGIGATYGTILTAMRTAITNAGRGGGTKEFLNSIGSDLAVQSLIELFLTGSPSLSGIDVLTSVITKLVRGSRSGVGELKQEPQLTACEPFDVHTKPFSL